MAQELREGDGKSGIARAGKRKWGYDPAQVDAFLERAHALYDSEGMNLTQHDIQNVSFDLRKNGYVIAQVDAALGRLERAVVDKQTTWEIAQHGRVTWKAKTEKLYHEVQNHAERNERERFKSGAPSSLRTIRSRWIVWSTRLWTRRRPHWALTALPKTMYGLWPISMRIRSTM